MPSWSVFQAAPLSSTIAHMPLGSAFTEAIVAMISSGVSFWLLSPLKNGKSKSMTLSSRKGLDLSGHRSRLISRTIAVASDLLIVMDARQADALVRGFGVPRESVFIAGDLDPSTSDTRAILDPWGKPLDAFEASFERIERCAASFVKQVRNLQ